MPNVTSSTGHRGTAVCSGGTPSNRCSRGSSCRNTQNTGGAPVKRCVTIPWDQNNRLNACSAWGSIACRQQVTTRHAHRWAHKVKWAMPSPPVGGGVAGSASAGCPTVTTREGNRVHPSMRFHADTNNRQSTGTLGHRHTTAWSSQSARLPPEGLFVLEITS